MFSWRCKCCFLVVDVTCLSCTCFQSSWNLMHCGSTGILCPSDTANVLCEWGSPKELTQLLHASPLLRDMLHCPVGLDLRNIHSKIKSRISRWWQQNAKSSVGSFKAELSATVQDAHPWRWSWWQYPEKFPCSCCLFHDGDNTVFHGNTSLEGKKRGGLSTYRSRPWS